MGIELKIDGKIFKHWKSARVSAGLDQLARAFDLAAYSLAIDFTEFIGSKCRLELDGEPVITGFVEATPINYSASAVERRIVGRSPAADLIDCSIGNAAKSWQQTASSQIVSNIAGVYKVAVDWQATSDQKIDYHTLPDDACGEAINRLLSSQRLRAISAADGRLMVIDEDAGEDIKTTIDNKKILSGSLRADFSRVYSTVQVFGKADADVIFGEAARDYSRRRLLYINADTVATAENVKTRAEYELLYRWQHAREATHLVSGWWATANKLYNPGQFVYIDDKITKINEPRRIVSCRYLYGSSGTTTELRTIPVNNKND